MTPNQSTAQTQVVSQSSANNFNFTKQQKIGLAILSFFVLLVIGLWYWQLQKNIIYPLYGGMSPEELAQKTASAPAVDTSQNDTDKDGLTDVQETTIYHTSPYLADTDSDGIPDGTEVKNGTDPNCPEGKTCVGGVTTDISLTPSSATGTDNGAGAVQNDLNVVNQLNQVASSTSTGLSQGGLSAVGGAGLSTDSVAALKKAFGDNPDPKFLREQFTAAATTDSDKQNLQKMSDAQLLQLYQLMIAGN